MKQNDPVFPAIDIDGKISVASRVSAFVFVIVLPTVAVFVAGWMLWHRAVSRIDLGILVGMFVATGLGVTVGYHRLFTHRSFETSKPVRYALALLGCMNAEGAPVVWAAQHRQHHAFSDQPGDPHSPFLNRKPGFFGALRALAFAHYGHVFFQKETIDPRRFTPDLAREPFLLWMERWAALVVVAGFLIPGLIGWAFTRTPMGAATGMLWGGFVRLFAITHVTGAVNSICHFFGRQRFNTEDQSRNVWWLAPFTLGESWHNGHHAFPTSARHGLVWWELDLSWCFIWTLEKFRVVRNVIRIDRNRIRHYQIHYRDIGGAQ